MIRRMAYRGATRQCRGADRRLLLRDTNLSSSVLFCNLTLPRNLRYRDCSVHFSTDASDPESVRRAEADLKRLFTGRNTPSSEVDQTTTTASIDSQQPHTAAPVNSYFSKLMQKYRLENATDYNNLITLFVQKGEVDQAQRLLDKLESPENPNVKPDVNCYNTVLLGWCTRGDDVAMARAEELYDRLRRLPAVEPDTSTYGIMISGWGNNDTNPRSTQLALGYFDTLKRRYMAGHANCKPDMAVYSSLIPLLVRSDEMDKAQSILEEMERSDDPGTKPDLICYNTVLHGWCKQGDDTAMSKAAELFQRLRQIPNIEPDIVTFGTMISGWCKNHTNRYAADRAFRYFEELKRRSRGGNERSMPNAVVCHSLINLLVNWGEPYKAQIILEEMERSDDSDIKPDLVCYNTVLHGWCKQGDDMAMSKAEELLDRLRRVPNLNPNVVTFTIMISGWGNNHTNRSAADRALGYFEELKGRYRDGDENCKPIPVVYHSLINSLVKVREPYKAQSILEEMERSDDPDIQPTILDYNSTLHGWCKGGDDMAMAKAEQLFDRLRRIPNIDPDTVTFGTMISGWAYNHTNPLSTDNALRYFEELKSRYMDGHADCKPDVVVCRSLINLLVKSGDAYKAQSILDEMERSDDPDILPNVLCYNAVLHGWCKQGDDTAMSKAEELFDRLRRNPRISPDLVTFRTMITGWCRTVAHPMANARALAYLEELNARYREGNEDCKPDKRVYETVMNMLVTNGLTSKAQILLEEIERWDDPDMSPDIVLYSIVLKGWCRSNDENGMTKAEAIFERLRRNPGIQPDIVTFGTMISGWSNNFTNPNAMDRALEYFEELKSRHRDGQDHCKPDRHLYKTIINLFVNRGKLVDAQSLLEEMERSDDPDIHPDVKIYSSVLNGWCRIGDNDAMAKVDALFDRLRLKPWIRPDVITFQTIISGWGRNIANPLAMDRALAYFEELKSRHRNGQHHCKPDQRIYTNIINLLAQNGKLVDAERLVEEMERSDDPDIRPDIKIYNSVLNGLCRIADDDAMAKAEAIFDRLRQKSGIHPDIVTFRAMISGWGKNHRNPVATDRAMAYFQDLQKLYRNGNTDCKPDIALYKSLIEFLELKGESAIAQRLRNEMKAGTDHDHHK